MKKDFYGILVQILFLSFFLLVLPVFAGVTVPSKNVPSSGLGKSWALVIGISQYEEDPHLPYAVNDAKAVSNLLRELGFQVTVLLDNGATRNDILDTIFHFSEMVGLRDQFLLYFSGRSVDLEMMTAGRRFGYLLPADGRSRNLVSTGISLLNIKELLALLPARQVLFLLDSCIGGVSGRRSKPLLGYSQKNNSLRLDEPARLMITAGGANQSAIDSTRTRHGLFTSVLLNSLKSSEESDFDADGYLTTSELFRTLRRNVTSDARRMNHDQTPEMWELTADKGEFVFDVKKKAAAGDKASTLNAERSRQMNRIEELERRLREIEENNSDPPPQAPTNIYIR